MPEKKEFQCTFFEASFDELDPEWKKLIDRADDAVSRAYALYSNYEVGAAILLDNSQIITGSNQENAAYPSGLCAERVAVFSASSNFPGSIIKRIVVKGRKKDENFSICTPCGGCRQVLLEYEIKQKHPIELLILNENKNYLIFPSIENLLPLAFYPKKI